MSGITTYQDNAVTTQSKGRLIVMLYDGAIRFLRLAIKEIENNNYEAKGRYINKAIDILNELNVVLDMDAGGEIAGNLRKLYIFMINRLSQGNVQSDPKLIRDVIKLMEELNSSWKAIT
ncbi:MAG: flagellar export chaperone FliS [Planctomycetes bacterium]|nr:flagellar export chaperone FliS [Planctomycetota bacterium]